MTNDKTVENILEAAQCNPDHIVFAKDDLDTYYRKKFAGMLMDKIKVFRDRENKDHEYVLFDDIKKVLEVDNG